MILSNFCPAQLSYDMYRYQTYQHSFWFISSSTVPACGRRSESRTVETSGRKKVSGDVDDQPNAIHY